MKRVGVYIYRASNVCPEILDGQMQILCDYAKVNGGTIVGKYMDIDCSRDYKCRKALKRLIRDYADGKLDEVLVLRIRHLSRNADEFLKLYKRITVNNVALNAVEQPINDDYINLLKEIVVLQEKNKPFQSSIKRE